MSRIEAAQKQINIITNARNLCIVLKHKPLRLIIATLNAHYESNAYYANDALVSSSSHRIYYMN